VATSTRRSVYLDVLRAVALARVVTYHTTTQWVLTSFTAMPLMFFIAGSLYANSIERRSTKSVVIDRYRRILFPYWLYVVALIVLWGFLGVLGEVRGISWISFIMPVLSFNGPEGPGTGTLLEVTWIPLWYLQMHLILSLVGGWMRNMQQRHGRRYWYVLVGLMVLTLPLGIGALFFYAISWSLGYLQHDGTLGPWLRESWKRARLTNGLSNPVLRERWTTIAIATGPIGFLAFIGFHNSNEAVAGLGGIALGVFWLAVALGIRPWLEPKLESGWVRSTVHWMSSRSLTIYLWHSMIWYGIIKLELPGYESMFARMAYMVVLIPVACVAVGWLEDISARKKPEIWPRLKSVPASKAPSTAS
jgi:peptidoglycan/LPS O-acetylase OafA/YrhL